MVSNDGRRAHARRFVDKENLTAENNVEGRQSEKSGPLSFPAMLIFMV